MTDPFQFYGFLCVLCQGLDNIYQIFKPWIPREPLFITCIDLLNNTSYFKTTEHIIKQHIRNG